MTMTLEELEEHVERLQSCVDRKMSQALAPETTPATSAYLLVQAFALDNRLDELRSACDDLRRKRTVLHLSSV